MADMTIKGVIETMAKALLLEKDRGDALQMCDNIMDKHNKELKNPGLSHSEVAAIQLHIDRWKGVKDRIKVLTQRIPKRK